MAGTEYNLLSHMEIVSCSSAHQILPPPLHTSLTIRTLWRILNQLANIYYVHPGGCLILYPPAGRKSGGHQQPSLKGDFDPWSDIMVSMS